MTTATATYKPITRSEALSEQETLRRNLARFVNQLTDNGNEIAQFFYDVFHGEYPDAKLHHRQQAAVNLAVMTGQLPEDTPGSTIRVAPVVREEDNPKPKRPKVTLKQIINKSIGEYIREETNNCRTLVSALDDILNSEEVFWSSYPPELRYQKATQIRANHKIAAAKEMIKRGLGSRNPYAYAATSSLEERMLRSRLSIEIREISYDGMSLVRFLIEDVVKNPKDDGKGNVTETPYTQTHRIWAIRELLHRALDIPWEHITPKSIDDCFRELREKDRLEAERFAAWRKADFEASKLTPEQEAELLATIEQMQRETDEADAKAAAKAKKKAKKAAKRAAAAKADAHDYNTAANGNNANNNAANGNNAASANKDNGNNTGDTPANSAPAPTAATATPPADEDARGARAVANVIARHPNVDLDTALENHHETAGIPKENLTHEQIYRAITAEANFQKRQAIIQNRLNAKKSNNAPEDNDPPKTRSP